MKNIEDIELMELEELETAALEQNLTVPQGLEDRIKASLAAKSIARQGAERSRTRWIPYVAVAVAASLAAIALIPRSPGLVDTFDDPYLAYAQVEATFQTISNKMATGKHLAAKAEETAEKTILIVNKITE